MAAAYCLISVLMTLRDQVPEGQIQVKTSATLYGWLLAKAEGGKLRLEGKKGQPATLDRHIHLHSRDTTRIVVEGGRKIFIASTPVSNHF